jgi:hypothetical protein
LGNSTGELVFNSNHKYKDKNHHSSLNATEVTAYQYLGMTSIRLINLYCFVCAGVGYTPA